MRALCGAIIVAGSMIGLGLTALAIGNCYHSTLRPEPLHLHEMDRPLIYILGFLTVTAVIGLGISFLGLAYHHHRRHHEMMRDHAEHAAGGGRRKS
jgi:hypothetical protein